MKRSDIAFFALFLASVLLVVFSGCSGSRDTQESDEDFFAPVDTSKADTTAMRDIPPDIQIGQGVPKAAEGNGEFGAPLGDEDLNTVENMSIEAIQDSLSIINEQISYLQTILEASTIDPNMYYHAQVKSWRITNPVLRDSVFYALMAVDSSIQSESGTDAEVLSTQTNDLIEVRFGTSIFKGITLKEAIDNATDKFLYKKIVESSDFSKDVELRDTNFTLPTPLNPELLTLEQLNDKFILAGKNPSLRKGLADISLYGLNVKAGPNWGASISMGDDELGLPFWTAGAMSIMGSYKEFKIGFNLPFKGGKSGGDRFPLFTIRDRLLNGARGFVAQFDVGNFGGKFTSTKVTDSDRNELTSFSRFFYPSQELLAYYSFAFSLNKTNYLRMKVGGGSYNIEQAHLSPANLNGTIVQDNTNTFTNLYVNIDYIHDVATERFGVSMQVYDLNLLTTAWLDIIPKTLSVELKYSRIIARPVRDWEFADFVMISPRWYFEF